MITVYKLTQPGDCEGRTTHTVGLFTDEDLAKEIGLSEYGSMAMGPSKGRISAVKVYDSRKEFIEDHPEAVRKLVVSKAKLKEIQNAALAKLTPVEREVLGFPR